MGKGIFVKLLTAPKLVVRNGKKYLWYKSKVIGEPDHYTPYKEHGPRPGKRIYSKKSKPTKRKRSRKLKRKHTKKLWDKLDCDEDDDEYIDDDWDCSSVRKKIKKKRRKTRKTRRCRKTRKQSNNSYDFSDI